MTAKHVTVEGLAAALREQSDGEAAAAENMDYLFSGSLDDLAGRVFAALPDDCPAEADAAAFRAMCDKRGLPYDLDGIERHLANGAAATKAFYDEAIKVVSADAAALAEALRDAVDVAHETDSLRSHSDDERKNGWFRAPLYRCTDAVCAEANAALAAHDRRVKGGE